MVQVGRVGGVRDEGGVRALRRGAGRSDTSGPEKSAQQGGGVGQGLSAVAGGAVAAGGGSSAHVGAANDGPFHIAV